MEEHGLTQAEIAAHAGIWPSHLSGLVSGIKGPPSAEITQRIKNALRLSAEESATLELAMQQSRRVYQIAVPCRVWKYQLAWNFHAMLPDLDREQARQIEAVLSRTQRRELNR